MKNLKKFLTAEQEAAQEDVVSGVRQLANVSEWFSIYDSKAQTWNKPFPAANADVAVRMVMQLLRQEPGHEFVAHAEDFTLFRVGRFDSNSGRFTPLDPESIALIMEVRSEIERSEAEKFRQNIPTLRDMMENDPDLQEKLAHEAKRQEG